MNMSRVGVINYGIGNISSITSAFRFVGAETKLVSMKEDIADCTHIVLPGVGTMKKAMEEIEKLQIKIMITSIIATEKPILGICLGMQLYATEGYEISKTSGLNVISGDVHRIQIRRKNQKLPRFGWISVSNANKERPSRLLEGINLSKFYFAHSYHFTPTCELDIAALDSEGLVAVVEKGNIFGTQFHPEKSGEQGLQVLRNFLKVREMN
jgi:glutamine amidotransferase